jgi:Rieske Fe-S protein
MFTDKTRREFLKEATAVVGGITIFGSLASALDGCATGLRESNTAAYMDVDVSGLGADNAALVASDPGPDGASVLIHHESGGSYEAYSMKCRHKGCNVDPPDAKNVLTCPCHGSQYDLSGKVIQGPAHDNLRAYPTTYDAANKRVRVQFKSS